TPPLPGSVCGWTAAVTSRSTMWFCYSAIGRIRTSRGSPSLRPRPTRSAISWSTATWRRPAAACSRWATSPIPRIRASRPRSRAERSPRERSRSGWRASARRRREGLFARCPVRKAIPEAHPPSLPGLTRQSILFCENVLTKKMDPRVSARGWGEETPPFKCPLGLPPPPRPRVELLRKLLVARLRRGDQRGVERAVRTDGTGLVLAGEIAREPRHQRFGLLRVGGEHGDDVLHRHRVVVGMPAVEIGAHGDG